MASIWSGTISFSLVAIPVRMTKALESGRVSFHLLHKKDNSPLARRMFCPEEEKIVPPDEIVRGYEIAPGNYIVMTEEELESVSPERSRTIEIVEFVDRDEVDPIYFDRPYYLAPSKGGEKAYRLLVEAMDRTNKVGLAKFVLSEREYLVALMSRDGALGLTTLHYSNEILPEEKFAPKKEKSSEEHGRIKKSIEKMVENFNPGKYANERKKKLLHLVEKKMKETAPVEAPQTEEEEGEGAPDLVAALEESMKKVKEKR